MVRCPKCGFEQDAGQECVRCGVIFAKLRTESGGSEPAAGVPVDGGETGSAALGADLGPASVAEGLPQLYEPPADRVNDLSSAGRAGGSDPAAPPAAFLAPDEARALAVGGGLALLVYLVPFTRFVMSLLSTLVHELGHTVAAWLFGYPAIPAFDFVYGGGFSLYAGRNGGLVGVVALAWVALVVALRRNRRGRLLAGALALVWGLLAASPWHQTVIAAAGHGAELAFAALFLYRALDGEACRIPAERPAYAFAGFFLQTKALGFAAGLATDEAARAAYARGKAGVLNDLHDIALDLQLRLDLDADVALLATLLLLLALTPPAIAWLAHRHRDRWLPTLAETLDPDPEAS